MAPRPSPLLARSGLSLTFAFYKPLQHVVWEALNEIKKALNKSRLAKRDLFRAISYTAESIIIGFRWSRNLESNFFPGGDFSPLDIPTEDPARRPQHYY